MSQKVLNSRISSDFLSSPVASRDSASPHRGDAVPRQGHPPRKIVSEMLGHSQIAVTLDVYSHVSPTMQRTAADALDAILGS